MMEEPQKPKMKESKETPALWHEERIARKSVKHELAAVFLGGPRKDEAVEKLKKRFGYTDKEIELLKNS